MSCTPVNDDAGETSYELTDSFKTYWYNQQAEISSYVLEQERYGQIRNGSAVLIFVTEHLEKERQVKTDQPNSSDYPVLKLNLTNQFQTGIYPYSMMTSVFTPVNNPVGHAVKINSTVQEWCGHTFNQINNRDVGYEIQRFSYFGSEGDTNYTIRKEWLEDELWTLIRIDPSLLPTGEVNMVPSMFYSRLRHQEIKPFRSVIRHFKNENESGLELFYPELERELLIRYEPGFPNRILGWEETINSVNNQKSVTKANLIRTVKSDYWNHKAVEDESIFDSLMSQNQQNTMNGSGLSKSKIIQKLHP